MKHNQRDQLHLRIFNIVLIKNSLEPVDILIQPLDLDPVAVTQAVGFLKFVAGQLIILPFQALMIFAESTQT